MKTSAKKTLALFLAAMLLMASLAACGSTGDDSSNTPPPSEAGTQITAPTDNSEQTKDEQGENEPMESAPTGGEIGNGYVDDWYLFGDLSFDSISISDDGSWEMRNGSGTGETPGEIFCEGTAEMDMNGDLFLYEENGDAVGNATLMDDELILVVTEDYVWTFGDYQSGDLVFSRQGASVSFEFQPLEGEGGETSEIGDGYVDSWFPYGDLNCESLTINDDGFWEMRNHIAEDGSGGHIFCEGNAVMEENGDLTLYEKDGGEVGCATLRGSSTGDELLLVLTMDFEWTFGEYMDGEGDIVLCREADSVRLESQPLDG